MTNLLWSLSSDGPTISRRAAVPQSRHQHAPRQVTRFPTEDTHITQPGATRRQSCAQRGVLARGGQSGDLDHDAHRSPTVTPPSRPRRPSRSLPHSRRRPNSRRHRQADARGVPLGSTSLIRWRERGAARGHAPNRPIPVIHIDFLAAPQQPIGLLIADSLRGGGGTARVYPQVAVGFIDLDWRVGPLVAHDRPSNACRSAARLGFPKASGASSGASALGAAPV